jgi:biotin carboxylase
MIRAHKVLHVLGGGMWQVPTIQLARSMGYRVLVTDMYQDRPGYAHADWHEVVDITDRHQTLATARQHRIDGIVCDTTDVGVPTAAFVAEQEELPGVGLETARRFTNKYLMRETLASAGLQQPQFALVESLAELNSAAERIGFPLVVKPVDNQSSRGVRIVHRCDDLSAALANAQKNSRRSGVLAEEFLPGIEATVEGLCLDGRYVTLGISDKEHFSHRPEVACRLTYPAAFGPGVMQRIEQTNAAVVQALGLTNGVTHAEYMVDGDRVQLVEIAVRGGGSRVYSHIVPHISGIDAPRLFLQYLMGEHPSVPSAPTKRAANLEFFQFPAGRVKSICGLEEARAIPGVAEILLEFSVGDVLQAPDDDRSRPGLMVVLGETRDEVLSISQRVKETLRVEVL